MYTRNVSIYVFMCKNIYKTGNLAIRWRDPSHSTNCCHMWDWEVLCVNLFIHITSGLFGSEIMSIYTKLRFYSISLNIKVTNGEL